LKLLVRYKGLECSFSPPRGVWIRMAFVIWCMLTIGKFVEVHLRDATVNEVS
jgi:hypothetical protein